MSGIYPSGGYRGSFNSSGGFQTATAPGTANNHFGPVGRGRGVGRGFFDLPIKPRASTLGNGIKVYPTQAVFDRPEPMKRYRVAQVDRSLLRYGLKLAPKAFRLYPPIRIAGYVLDAINLTMQITSTAEIPAVPARIDMPVGTKWKRAGCNDTVPNASMSGNFTCFHTYLGWPSGSIIHGRTPNYPASGTGSAAFATINLSGQACAGGPCGLMEAQYTLSGAAFQPQPRLIPGVPAVPGFTKVLDPGTVDQGLPWSLLPYRMNYPQGREAGTGYAVPPKAPNPALSTHGERVRSLGPIRKNPSNNFRRGKETKLILTPAARSAIGMAINAITESIDLIRPIWDALPDKYQTRGAPPQVMLKEIFTNFDKINWTEAVLGIVENQIEDKIFGAIGSALTKAQRRAYLKGYLSRMNLATGPAL